MEQKLIELPREIEKFTIKKISITLSQKLIEQK